MKLNENICLPSHHAVRKGPNKIPQLINKISQIKAAFYLYEFNISSID